MAESTIRDCDWLLTGHQKLASSMDSRQADENAYVAAAPAVDETEFLCGVALSVYQNAGKDAVLLWAWR